MGIGRALHTRAFSPSLNLNNVAGAGFEVIIDSVPVNDPFSIYRGAFSIPGIYRSALLLADLMGSVPWDSYRTKAGQPNVLISPTPPLLEQPFPPDTRMTTFSSWAMDLIMHGNAVGVYAARNADGYPTAVMPVSAELVGVRRNNMWAYNALPIGPVEYLIGGKSYGPRDIFHVKGPCRPGALRGFGVLEAHLHNLGAMHELGRQSQQMATTGVPTSVLKMLDPDSTEADAANLKSKWLAAQRDRTVAVINASTDFTPLAWNPEQMQLIEARQFSLREQALIMGVPLHFLGADVGSRTYSNIEQESLDLLKFSMSGHLGRFEQTLSGIMPRGTVAKANLDSILRADTLARYQAHQIAVANHFLTVDEVRELEDRPPLTAAQKAEILASQPTTSLTETAQVGPDGKIIAPPAPASGAAPAGGHANGPSQTGTAKVVPIKSNGSKTA